MAHYVISDIHGEADRFHAMLEKIGFSENDTLYIIGDVIDRGPNGVELLQEIMAAPNMEMLLGNHEYMCLTALRLKPSDAAMQHWGRNGSAPTISGFLRITPEERTRILDFLCVIPSCLNLTVEGRNFHLVHGFPGETEYERVWNRPEPDTPNPFEDGRTVIVGHTPVIYLGQHNDLMYRYRLKKMEVSGEHLKIFHGKGFIDLDCGCGHDLKIKKLACLRLEDMEEFYA